MHSSSKSLTTKTDFADAAAEKIMRKCSTSWPAYKYLQNRVHDVWLPDYARQHLRRIIRRSKEQIQQRREYRYAYSD